MTRPMRVLMTADTVGGVWSYAIDLIGGLCSTGIDVGLATLGASLSPAQWEQCRRIRGLEVFESRYRLEWMDDPWDDVARSGEWLMWLADRLRPDVVHLNGYGHGALPWQVPVVVVSHSCVTSWWQAVHRQPPPSRYRTYQRSVRAGLQAATAVVAPSRAMLRVLQDGYGTLPHAQVIHNGIPLSEYAPASKQPFVLGAGRLWDSAKNLSGLARLAARIPWPIRLAGPTEGFESAGEDDGVELLGPLSRKVLIEHYARASIFAHPARYEPFGLAPLEAAACGCALVLGDIESLREIWGDAARYVEPDDTEALFRHLDHLISRPRERQALGQAARARALVYGQEAMRDAYRDLYREIVLRPPRFHRGSDGPARAHHHPQRSI